MRHAGPRGGVSAAQPLQRPAEPRRARVNRADGTRRRIAPLLIRLAHERAMATDEMPDLPSIRPRPWLN